MTLNLRYHQVPACPVCGGSGRVVITGATDWQSQLPGEWQYRRCGDCQTVWMDPRPVDADFPALYAAGYYTHVAAPDRPSSFRHRVLDAVLAHQLGYAGVGGMVGVVGAAAGVAPAARRKAGFRVRYLPAPSNGRALLDVGTGAGQFLRDMAARGWDVSGVEPDVRAAAVARAAGHPVQVAGVADCQLDPAGYDAITMTHVIEHTPDPVTVLTRLYAALRPGGSLVSLSPNPAGVYARRFGRHWTELDPPRHLVLPSPAGLRIAAERLGGHYRVWTQSRAPRAIYRQSGRLAGAGSPAGYLTARAREWLTPDGGDEVVLVLTRPAS